MDELPILNDTIEELLKQIHIIKKARIKEYGYTQNNDMNILRCVAKYENTRHDQATALKISKQLNITQATITPMINRLVENGALQRIISPTDKRAKLLSITEFGMDLLLESKEAERKQVEKLISYLGEEDTKEGIRILQKVVRYFEKSNTDKE